MKKSHDRYCSALSKKKANQKGEINTKTRDLVI